MNKRYIGTDYWWDDDDNEYKVCVIWENNVDKDTGVDEWELISAEVENGKEQSDLEFASMLDDLDYCGPPPTLEPYEDYWY